MNLEEGKKYVDRRGRVFGPMVLDQHTGYFGEQEDQYASWFGDGRVWAGSDSQCDLIAEHVEICPMCDNPCVPGGVACKECGEFAVEYAGCPKEEKFPQYWTALTPEFAFIKRVDTNHHYCIDFDGDDDNHLCCWDDASHAGRKQITKEQAEALVKKKPVESPDDWVTQDRVPPRDGMDQVRWSNWPEDRWISPCGPWEDPEMHGFHDKEDDTVLSVRCRRKDLPAYAAPPLPERTPVTLWVPEGGDWPVRVSFTGEKPKGIGSWVKVCVGTDGFFVEGGV